MNKYFMRFLNLFDGVPKWLRISFMCLVATVIISQIGLVFNTTRHFLTFVDILDGALPAASDGVISTGTVTLRLSSGKPCENIAILVNGEHYAYFDEQIVEITISNQSVIEIVNDSKGTIEVAIESLSDNLEATYSVPNCIVDNLAVICRVIFKL